MSFLQRITFDLGRPCSVADQEGIRRRRAAPRLIRVETVAVPNHERLRALALLLVAFMLPGASASFLLLVRQWGPTFCSGTRCSVDPPSRFTLHGLWPQRDDGTYPSFCSNGKFDANALPSSLRTRMSCEWPSFTGTSESFWGREWKKHGTCAPDLFASAEDYFRKTLELNAGYRVEAALELASIEPEGSVSRAKLADALDGRFGAKNALKCRGRQLSEIWTCIDPETMSAMDCPADMRTGCPSEVRFPDGGETEEACEVFFDAPTETTRTPAATQTQTRPMPISRTPTGDVDRLDVPVALMAAGTLMAVGLAE
ncbi:ribonuclease T2-like protein [Hyaloraphidium curvatum]|nr:ribonuclease T2-like protein [Hyaloraphidium curvatum]